MTRRASTDKPSGSSDALTSSTRSASDTASELDKLTGRRALSLNISWNVIGLALPIGLAIACTPTLVRTLGTQRFGVLLLSWTLVGYVSLFDLGLGRAVTQLVATRLGSGGRHEVSTIVWTSLLLLAASGLAGMSAGFVLAPWLTSHVIHPPPYLHGETLDAVYILALSVPAVVIGSALRGVLEAVQRFDYVNAVRIPSGVVTYLGPVILLPFTHSISAIVALLVAGRFAAGIAQYLLCIRALPEMKSRSILRLEHASALLRLGGWMTISNVLLPIITYGDRFAISAYLSTAAVAYYATPFDTLTKLLIIPTAVTYVLFPAFAAVASSAPNKIEALVSRAARYSLLAAFPTCLVIVAFSREWLTIWLGPEFGKHSTAVAELVALGVFANILAQTPYTLIQGIGRPDLTTKMLLFELPAYALILALLLRANGIEGVASAWAVRTAVECSILIIVVRHLVPSYRDTTFILGGAIALAGMTAFLYPFPLSWRALLVGVELIAFAAASWLWLAKAERKGIVLWLQGVRALQR